MAATAAGADVVVVLGAAVWPGGVPSPALRRRTLHGVRLVLQGCAGVLIVSGGLGRHPPAEAVVMRDLALEAGLAAEAIVVDDRSADTLASGRACAAILRSRGWRSAIIVSDDFHLPRSLFIFRALGVPARASVAPGSRAALGLKRWSFYAMRELAAWPWTIARLALSGLRGS